MIKSLVAAAVAVTLGSLAGFAAAQVKPPAIIVVGGVVAVAHPEAFGETAGSTPS